jgi:NAD(P)-dependent dehydrogenase (short-subunit alcohol dehydrogenase family)
MGRAAAIAFAREGADVAINYFPSEEPDAQEVARLISEAGRKAIAIPGDLRDEGFCKDLVARAISGLGGLDILVSNAGRQQAHDSILDISTEQFDSTMKTNIYAPFWLIKAALPACRRAPASSRPPRSRPTIPHRTYMTTRRQRRLR